MHDAANTREDEGPCICDSCDKNHHDCNCQPEVCERALCEDVADLAVKARKEERP